MHRGRLLTSYAECRTAFRSAADACGADRAAFALPSRGPDGQELTIDIATLGSERPVSTLVVLSGVHGVEAPVNSALQVELLERVSHRPIPDDVRVVLVHVVNPWGMAYHRRQNESNVDLNRNWRRSDRAPEPNPGYALLHALVCPDRATLPDPDEAVPALGRLVDEHGVAWVTHSITSGQYTHPDGLHFGGHETQPACRILERELPRRSKDPRRLIALDLHTGVGPYGALTLLTNHSPGSPELAAVDSMFGVLTTSGVTIESRSSAKPGSIAGGIADVMPDVECIAVTAEFGTAGDLEQLAATYQEQWVHRRGDVTNLDHAAARERYRRCFTPDDPEWETRALDAGTALLDRALEAAGET